jgi:hypothetical protein
MNAKQASKNHFQRSSASPFPSRKPMGRSLASRGDLFGHPPRTVFLVTDWPLFGIECFVAAGTLAMALFTFRLARSTKLDVEAQWRPLLVPGEFLGPDNASFLEALYTEDDGDFQFAVKNVGKGAALDLFAEFGLGAIADCDPPGNPVVAVNDTTLMHGGLITFEDLEQSNGRVEVTVIYRDLAGNRHETFIVYGNRDDGEPWEVREVTPKPPETSHPITA